MNKFKVKSFIKGGCPYCIQSDDRAYIIDDKSKTSIWIADYADFTALTTYNGQSNTSSEVIIHYCPICGRKLDGLWS